MKEKKIIQVLLSDQFLSLYWEKKTIHTTCKRKRKVILSCKLQQLCKRYRSLSKAGLTSFNCDRAGLASF